MASNAVAPMPLGPPQLIEMENKDDKITAGWLRSTGVHSVRVFCADHKCSHSVSVNMNTWGDDVVLTEIEKKFVCKICGRRGALIQPNYNEQPPPGPKR